jgi:transcriptional regulator with XRE-family HTH domain
LEKDLRRYKLLGVLMTKKMKEQNLSARQAAEIIGTSHTTILRAVNGEIVDLDTIIKISDWLDVRPATLLNSLSTSKSALSDKMAALVEYVPSLKEVFEKAVDSVEKQKADPGIVDDIVAYASWRLSAIKK